MINIFLDIENIPRFEIWITAISIFMGLFICSFNKKYEKEKEIEVDNKSDEIESLIVINKSPKKIGEYLRQKYRYDQTLIFLNISKVLLKKLIKDKESNCLALGYLKRHRYKSYLSKKDIIKQFDLKENVFCVNDDVSIHLTYPEESNFINGQKSIPLSSHDFVYRDINITKVNYNGTLILHRGYLCFFENLIENSKITDKSKKLLTDLALGSLSSLYKPIGHGISVINTVNDIVDQDYSNFFSKTRVEELIMRKDLKGSIFISLDTIRSVNYGPRKNRKNYSFIIEYKYRNTMKYLWFESTTNNLDWAKKWIFQIKLACIHAGCTFPIKTPQF